MAIIVVRTTEEIKDLEWNEKPTYIPGDNETMSEMFAKLLTKAYESNPKCPKEYFKEGVHKVLEYVNKRMDDKCMLHDIVPKKEGEYKDPIYNVCGLDDLWAYLRRAILYIQTAETTPVFDYDWTGPVNEDADVLAITISELCKDFSNVYFIAPTDPNDMGSFYTLLKYILCSKKGRKDFKVIGLDGTVYDNSKMNEYPSDLRRGCDSDAEELMRFSKKNMESNAPLSYKDYCDPLHQTLTLGDYTKAMHRKYSSIIGTIPSNVFIALNIKYQVSDFYLWATLWENDDKKHVYEQCLLDFNTIVNVEGENIPQTFGGKERANIVWRDKSKYTYRFEKVEFTPKDTTLWDPMHLGVMKYVMDNASEDLECCVLVECEDEPRSSGYFVPSLVFTYNKSFNILPINKGIYHYIDWLNDCAEERGVE